MLIGSGVLFVLVMGLLWLVYARPGFGASLSPMRWVIYGGLAMPLVVVTVLTGYALFAGEHLLPRPLADQPPRVVAEGSMWDWRFSYPDIDGASPTPVLHIPANTPVDVVVVSTDVIHSFWVPRLAGKIDAIPGHENVIRIQADRPGIYHGVCAEFCGTGHTDMRFVLEAHDQQDYEAAVLGAADGGNGQ